MQYQVVISIKGDIVSTCHKHKRGHCLFAMRWSRVLCDKHKRGHRFQVISIKRDIVVMAEAPHQPRDHSSTIIIIFRGALATRSRRGYYHLTNH